MKYKTKIMHKLGWLFFSVPAILVSCASSIKTYQNKALNNDISFVADTNQQLEVHTISLNNKAHGDCTIIKFGNTEVLIDAGGSVKRSKDRILNALNKYVQDNVIEYAIMTHGDADHISNATGEGALGSWLGEGENRINFLIDFDISLDDSLEGYPNRKVITKQNEATKDAFKYVKFRDNRKSLVNKRIRHHLVSSMCVHRKRNGIKKEQLQAWQDFANLSDSKYITDTYPLSYTPNNPEFSDNPKDDVFDMDDTGCRLKILYNYFYDHPVEHNVEIKKGSEEDMKLGISSADYNVISICSMVELDTSKGDPIRTLFCGDLEEYDSASNYARIKGKNSEILGGETLLYEYNKDSFTSPITLYKASHHCSDTSNSPQLLEKIRPLNVVIPGCAGGDYGFPSGKLPNEGDENKNKSTKEKGNDAEFGAISELSNYTDHIYITDQYVEDEESGTGTVMPYYGDINFFANSEGEHTFTFTKPGEDTAINISKSLFFTDWMKNNRLFNVRTFNLTNSSRVATNCTYIKIGSVDIIVGAGCNRNDIAFNPEEIAKKVDYLCNDHVIDYLIVPTPYISDWQYILGINKKKTYILQKTDIQKVNNFIYYHSNNMNEDYDKFIERMNKSNLIENSVPIDKLTETIKVGSNNKSGMEIQFTDITDKNYYIEFLNCGGNELVSVNPETQSMYTLVKCGSYQYLNIGNDYTFGYVGNDNYLLDNNPEIKESIHILQVPYFGRNAEGDTSKLEKFHKATGCTKKNTISTRNGADTKPANGGYLFLNTYYGETSKNGVSLPVGGGSKNSFYVNNVTLTTKGCVKNAPYALRGDIMLKATIIDDRIYHFRFKKTGSLSFDNFTFCNPKAVNRSASMSTSTCQTLNSDDIEKCVNG